MKCPVPLLVELLSRLWMTLKSDPSKLHHNNKVHSHWPFMSVVEGMSHSVVFMQVAGEWLKIMKGSCRQLTDSPLH